MNTQEVAAALKLTGRLMELHGENQFKIRALGNAAFKLTRSGLDLSRLSKEEIEAIEGIGKGIAAKIVELMSTGTSAELEALRRKTPDGVIRLMDVKGLGPKKVFHLWRELGIENIGELLYACRENRLVALKGFGIKTQEEVRKNVEYLLSNEGSFHYATVEPVALACLDKLRNDLKTNVEIVGEVRRKMEVIRTVQYLASSKRELSDKWTVEGLRLEIASVAPEIFYREVLKRSAAEEFLNELGPLQNGNSMEEVFENSGLKPVPAEWMETRKAAIASREHKVPQLIDWQDLRGCLHNHSLWSDGLHSLKDMAVACKELGLEYFGICDHSRSASYAGGLTIEKVYEQHREIDALNEELKPFRILKGIESDILSDGSLDYPEEVLAEFELVVASVHQNLKMEEVKATERLIRAIENPYTHILGHPCGRLLLSRPGYPLQYSKIIDACAANGVAIELNANPWRLDIDWRWIHECMNKGVKISINPDAHEREGMLDMHYGIYAARKGGLTADYCLNALTLADLMKYLKKN
ncbi:MAG: DNA polymerase/3'-5' exonuclease PolX [Bacteroidia bacterium]|nr:DNA polymerase/3'-5' exonuclease PolX [Bacteroidia bacterium]